MGERRLWLEPGFAPGVIAGMRARVHDALVHARHDVAFGGGRVIERLSTGGYRGGSDGRRDGQAVGM